MPEGVTVRLYSTFSFYFAGVMIRLRITTYFSFIHSVLQSSLSNVMFERCQGSYEAEERYHD